MKNQRKTRKAEETTRNIYEIQGLISYLIFSYYIKNRIAQRAPQVFQRFYYSNNTFYNNTEIDLESTFSQDIGIDYSSGSFWASCVYQLDVNRGVYYFDTDVLNWVNSSYLSDNSMHQIGLKFGYKKGDFPVTEKLSNTILSLPMHPYLNEDDLDKIVGVIKTI